MSGFAAIGECMIELSGANGEQWRMGFAGDTLNTTWYVRALTAPQFAVDYVTAFGDDPFSVKQRTFLRDNGINTANSPIIPGARPGLYAITLTGVSVPSPIGAMMPPPVTLPMIRKHWRKVSMAARSFIFPVLPWAF